MSLLAIDVALLPPDGLADAAIALNRALSGIPSPPIRLDDTGCLPHLSLAMGCVRERDVAVLSNLLTDLAARHPPIQLTPAAFHVRQSRTGFVVASLEMERTEALQRLHERVLTLVEPFICGEAAPAMFLEPDVIPASTLQWVDAYVTAAGFERFWPHITLGMGSLPDGTPLPSPGTASRLALCHLGPHCTCRRVLGETRLRGG